MPTNDSGQIVVLAEKPSVGRDIARVLGATTRGEGCLTGNGYIVTWAVGHLVTLQEPDEMDAQYKKWRMDTLPILPESIPLKVISQTKAQYRIVSRLLNAPTTSRVICATDAGREGELIFRYIYTLCGCKKPFDRLWISSMTDEAIAEGFRGIRPGADYDGLYRSARCRSEADWLVGMNASRAFTLRYDTLLSVGRVQTPTLAILVRRRQEIEAFQPEGFATLTADFGDYTGVWFREGLEPDTHLKDRASAEAIAQAVKGQTGTVIHAETQRKRELPPQLYDLTSLQRDANRLLGFTAEKTLKVAQSLYEKRKALTYPRTDSRYLPPDMVPRVVQTMHLLPESYQPLVPPALPDGRLPVTRRTVDASKVSDHHALIPTAKRVRPEEFEPDERQLYDLVARRLLAAFYPPCEYDQTKVVTRVGEHTFRSAGRVTLQEGWRAVPPLANPPRKSKKSADEDERPLPALKEGDTRPVKKTTIKEDTTKPPAPYTDATLLSAMENAGRESDDEEIVRQMKGSGIGTPATRAAIIERLLQVKYAERRGKSILATDKGVQLIAVMPEEIASPEMTGRWELALDRITSGAQDAGQFMDSIRRFSAFLVHYAQEKARPVIFPAEERRGRGKGGFRQSRVPDCVCPVCGQGQVLESDRAFSCSQSGCHFTLWKDGLSRGGGPALSAKLLTLLLRERRVQGSTGLLTLNDANIAFYPNGQEQPSVTRPLTWQKRGG